MEYRTRKIVMPGDLNPWDILFGGKLMAWVDEECFIYAACQLNSRSLVTKFIGEVEFNAPARAGDIIEIGVDTVSIGTTSLTLTCVARNQTTKQTICRIERIVFVQVDQNGKAAPHQLHI